MASVVVVCCMLHAPSTPLLSSRARCAGVRHQRRGKPRSRLRVQAYVINEEENHVLGSDARCFQFLGQELSSAVSSTESSRSLNGYRTVEVLAAINKLSVHNDNKRRIIDSGVLSSYTCLLSPCHSLTEQLLTTHGLWTLAMDCPQDVAGQDGCIQSMETFVILLFTCQLRMRS